MSTTPPSSPAPIESWEVLDLLVALVQKSLVVYEEDEQGRGRYRLLETVGQYGRDRLLEASDGKAVRDRHGECFLQLAEGAHAAAGEGKGAEAFERLESEHDNLRAALEWSDGRDEERMLRLAGALGEFWFERGYWNEGRQWLERALAGAPGAEPTAERARALAAAGRFATRLPDNSAAWKRLEESIELYQAFGDTRGLIETLTHRSLVLWLREGNRVIARRAQEEAVALARTLDDPRLLAMALSTLGELVGQAHIDGQARIDDARLVLEESVALARRVGDRGLMAQSLERLGWISLLQQDWAKAREFLEESVELARAAKNKSLLAWALHFLAGVLSQQGDPERAKSLQEECLRLARELRIPRLVGRAMGSLARHGLSYEKALPMVEQAAGEAGPEVVQYAVGGLVAAAPSYEEALRMVEKAAAEYGPLVIQSALAPLATRAPSQEEALQRIEQAAREYGLDMAIHPLGALGHAARERGDYEWAATCYRRSLVLRQEVGDNRLIAQSLEDFAGLAARQEQWERGARLLGAAEGLYAAMGWTLPAASAAEYERAIQGAREALGEAGFAAAWTEGRAMSLEETVAFALAEEA